MKKVIVLGAVVLVVIIVILLVRNNMGDDNANHEVAFGEGEWWNENQDNLGHPVDMQLDELLPFFGNPVATKEEAFEMANIIYESLNMGNRTPPETLLRVFHDTAENIWIFSYGIADRNIIGAGFRVAVNGENSEVIGAWIRGG